MIRGIGRLTVYSRIILWVQPPVKELPTFPFLGFYSHNVTARHGIKKEKETCAWRVEVRVETRSGPHVLAFFFLLGPNLRFTPSTESLFKSARRKRKEKIDAAGEYKAGP